MTSTIAPPQIASLLIIGPKGTSPSINEGYSYPDALAELARLDAWPSATVKFAEGGGLYGTPAQVRSLLARFGAQ